MNKLMHLTVGVSTALAFTAGAYAASLLQNLDIGRAIGAAKDLGTAATGIPEKEEIALGRELAGRTMGAAPLINDARLQGYVNRVGRAVAAESSRPDLPWRFGVIDTPSVNAFAAPGGVILITRGLYEILDNEAQLAAVLGHEVAHVMQRHHVNVMRQQHLGSGVAQGAQATVGQRDRTGLANQFLGTGAEIFARGLDQNAEYEADDLGVTLAAKAGYSPSGMVDVLHKLQARAGQPSTNLLFETHPHPNDRLTKLGDVLAAKIASLPEGSEPRLQVAASSLTKPVAASARPAAPAQRSLANEGEAQQQQQQQAPGFPGGLFGGGRSRDSGGIGNPMDMLRGIR